MVRLDVTASLALLVDIVSVSRGMDTLEHMGMDFICYIDAICWEQFEEFFSKN